MLPPHAWHDSLRRWLHRRHGWKVESSSILDATGVIPALAATIRAFCVPGDKVIVQTPVYNCFFRTIRNQGCEVLESPLRRVAAKDGRFVREGAPHGNEYVHNPEDYQMVYMNYSRL